jgi:hypothetical protein
MRLRSTAVSFDRSIHLLENPWIKYGFFTFCGTALSLVIKFSSRNNTRKRMEDWAVGFDLAQVSIFALLLDGTAEVIRALLVDQATIPKPVVEKLVLLPFVLLFMFGGLVVLALFVRGRGWNYPAATPGAGLSAAGAQSRSISDDAELNWFGIIAPLILGIIYLMIPILWVGGN